MADETYYSILEIPEIASPEEIKAAYRRLIQEVHPDRLAQAPAYWQREAKEKTQVINEAYDVLSKPEKRRLYDAQLSAYRGVPGSASGTSRAQSPSAYPAGSGQRQPHSSTTSRSSSGTTHQQSAQHARPNPQQQTPPTSAPPSNSASQSAQQAAVSRMSPGSRFVCACVCIFSGFAFELAFRQATSFGEQVASLLVSTTAVCGGAYLYRHKLRSLIARTGVQGLTSQVVVTIGIIACAVLVGRIPGNQDTENSPISPHNSAGKELNGSNGAAKSNSVALNPVNTMLVSRDFVSRFPWYVDSITTMVRQSWYTQEVNPNTHYGTNAKVSFMIGRDGGVTNIRLSVPSSSRTLDMTARQAVERVAKVGELPSGYAGNAIALEYTFTYDQPPRLTEGDRLELAGRGGSNSETQLHFTPEELKDYYAVYSAPDVQYLRVLFDGYLNDVSGHEGEFKLLKQWSPDYYRSKFIVVSHSRGFMGGTSIDLIFQQEPDKVFYAWVYTNADQSLELRSFVPSDSWAKADMSKVRALYKSLLEDKDHAM